jgi:hypothetical protein
MMTDTSGNFDQASIPGDSGTSSDADPAGNSGPNPAWKDVLDLLPEQFHSLVTPHFQKWDQSAQDRITSVNERFKEYAPFAEHGIGQNDLTEGLRLSQAINQDPKAVYDALAAAYGYDSMAQMNAADPAAANAAVQDMTGQNAQQAQQAIEDPRVSKLEQGVNIMAQMLLDQQQAEVSQQADDELETELSALRAQHGDFDETYVLARMNNGATAEQAVAAFNELKNSLLTNNPRPFAPSVIGSSSGQGAGVPSGAVDVTKLNGNETRNLVADMLRHAAAQNSGG